MFTLSHTEPLGQSLNPFDTITFILCTFLLSGMARYSRLTLYIFKPRPRMNHFFKESLFLVPLNGEWYIRKKNLVLCVFTAIGVQSLLGPIVNNPGKVKIKKSTTIWVQTDISTSDLISYGFSFTSFKNFILFIIYFCLHWVFAAVCGLSLLAAMVGYSFL